MVLTKGSLFFLLIVLGPASGPVRAEAQEKTTPPPTQDAKPVKPPQRIRLGGEIMKKQLRRRVNPLYPQEAKDQRLQGTVRIHIVLGKDGKVLQADIISGHPVLAQAALEAVRKWEYRPVLLNGQPVEVDSTVDVVFSLV